VSFKTLHDLELIRRDCETFGILWRRVQDVAPLHLLDDEEGGGQNGTVGKVIPSAAVVFYKDGSGSLYPGRADRQTAVFRWLLTEAFCHAEAPLEVDGDKFRVLVRSFRSFVLVAHSLGVRAARKLIANLKKYAMYRRVGLEIFLLAKLMLRCFLETQERI